MGGGGDDSLTGGSGMDEVMESGDSDYTLTDTSLSGSGNDTLDGVEMASISGGASANTLNASAFSGSARTGSARDPRNWTGPMHFFFGGQRSGPSPRTYPSIYRRRCGTRPSAIIECPSALGRGSPANRHCSRTLRGSSKKRGNRLTIAVPREVRLATGISWALRR